MTGGGSGSGPSPNALKQWGTFAPALVGLIFPFATDLTFLQNLMIVAAGFILSVGLLAFWPRVRPHFVRLSGHVARHRAATLCVAILSAGALIAGVVVMARLNVEQSNNNAAGPAALYTSASSSSVPGSPPVYAADILAQSGLTDTGGAAYAEPDGDTINDIYYHRAVSMRSCANGVLAVQVPDGSYASASTWVGFRTNAMIGEGTNLTAMVYASADTGASPTWTLVGQVGINEAGPESILVALPRNTRQIGLGVKGTMASANCAEVDVVWGDFKISDGTS